MSSCYSEMSNLGIGKALRVSKGHRAATPPMRTKAVTQSPLLPLDRCSSRSFSLVAILGPGIGL